jgi:hypothetical protein
VSKTRTITFGRVPPVAARSTTARTDEGIMAVRENSDAVFRKSLRDNFFI